MEERACVVCGGSLEHKSSSRQVRYCSEHCRDAARWERSRARSGELRLCEGCGDPLAREKRSDARWCSRECGSRSRARERRLTDPDFVRETRERYDRWVAANPERHRRVNAARYERRREDPDWVAERGERARITRAARGDYLEPDRSDELCWHCGSPKPLRSSSGRRRRRNARYCSQRCARLGSEQVRRGQRSGIVFGAEWQRLVNRYSGMCAYCHTARATQQDHVIPLARGGRHTIGNVLPACGTCNASKKAALLVEWRYGRAAGVARVDPPAGTYQEQLSLFGSAARRLTVELGSR